MPLRSTYPAIAAATSFCCFVPVPQSPSARRLTSREAAAGATAVEWAAAAGRAPAGERSLAGQPTRRAPMGNRMARARTESTRGRSVDAARPARDELPPFRLSMLRRRAAADVAIGPHPPKGDSVGCERDAENGEQSGFAPG